MDGGVNCHGFSHYLHRRVFMLRTLSLSVPLRSMRGWCSMSRHIPVGRSLLLCVTPRVRSSRVLSSTMRLLGVLLGAVFIGRSLGMYLGSVMCLLRVLLGTALVSRLLSMCLSRPMRLLGSVFVSCPLGVRLGGAMRLLGALLRVVLVGCLLGV
jgi:hypothetical protein